MNELSYSVPLGDVLLRESTGSLQFTNSLCAMCVGGPSGSVTGKIWITGTELAFRPTEVQAHPQPLTQHQFYQFEETIPRWDFGEPVWLWLTLAQRNRLLELGVLSEISDGDPIDDAS